MELQTLIGNDAPVLIAAAAGAASVLAVDRDSPPGRVVAGIPVSFAVSIYCTAAICEYASITSASLKNLIAFGLGMIGTTVATQFVRWGRGLDLGTLFDRLVTRRGTPPTPQPSEEKK